MSTSLRAKSTWSLLYWCIPAALMIVAAIGSASGLQFTSNGVAADNDDVLVQASIAAELHITTPCADQGPTALTTAAAAPEDIGAGCAITFGTNNNAAGANLKVINNVNDATNFLCYGAVGGAPYARNCATATYVDAAAGGALVAAVAAGEAGVKLTSVATATADFTATTTVYGVPKSNGTAATVCHTTNTTDGTCTMMFVARTNAQQAGIYQGQAHFTVTAR